MSSITLSVSLLLVVVDWIKGLTNNDSSDRDPDVFNLTRSDLSGSRM